MTHPLPLISQNDSAAVTKRFGSMPVTHAVGLIGPPPTPADMLATDGHIGDHANWLRAWKALRRQGIGASEVATVAGVRGAYGSPFALWWQKKTGMEIEQGNTDVMVMGTRLETLIGEEWQTRNPEAMLVRPGAGLFAHPAMPWLMATPDFLAVYKVEGDPWPHVAPVECKAYEGGKGWGKPGTDEVPEHIRCQVLMQCDVLGVDRGHVARMQAKRITLYTIDAYPRDDNGLRRAQVHHWQTCAAHFVESLKGNDPPTIDGSDATEAVLAAQNADIHEDERATVSNDLAMRYRLALDQVSEANARLALRKNLLRAAMGKAEYAVDGDGNLVAQRRRYKRGTFTIPAGEVDGLWPAGDKP